MAVWSSVTFAALTEDHRLDAEHYRPECLAQAKRIAALPHKPLSEIADISDGNHLSIAESFSDSGVRYLRGQDLSDFFIADKTPVFVPESTYAALKRSHMRPGDILLGIVATIGTVSLVTDRFGQLTGNCKIGIVRPRKIESEFLATYFLSELGQREIHRWARGSVQTGIILPDLKKLPIPIVSEPIRLAIVENVREAYVKKQECEKSLAAAESMLNKALGLADLDLTPCLFYEARYSDASAAGRLDAEYFTPRMQNLLAALSRDGRAVADVANLAKRHFRPKSGQTFDYIEIADVTANGTVESASILGEEAPSRAQWIVKPGDIITSTVRPIRRLSALILPEQGGYVCSSGFAVLQPKDVEPEVLLAYFRLPLVCELLDLHATASMYPAISTADLLRIPASLPSKGVRQAIVEKVRESFAARRQAQALLDAAKRAVEIAIEESEAAALKFLKGG
ncbi:MAG: restriction endonuclease subunit S [Elusimicrobia bacterium]|nr:restriction endonuclease subunit S [Elusimicrobiota bacterium]